MHLKITFETITELNYTLKKSPIFNEHGSVDIRNSTRQAIYV